MTVFLIISIIWLFRIRIEPTRRKKRRPWHLIEVFEAEINYK